MIASDSTKLSGSVVLITGACGFIGSHLVAALCASGVHVTGVSRDISGGAHSGVQYIEADMTHAEQIGKIVSSVCPDYVFHLASSKNKAAATHDFREGIKNDVLGTLNLIEACMYTGGVKCFVHLGSCEVYGGMDAPFMEQSRETPVSAYSFSKVAVTYMLQALGRLHDFHSVELRPSVVYGPGQGDGMFIPSLIMSLLTNKHFPMSMGKQTRDLIYIDDLIQAMVLAALQPEGRGEIINICGGSPVGLLSLARMVAGLIGDDANKLLGVGELPYRPGEAMNYWASNEKAAALLDWKPKVQLSEGLARTVDYYRSELHQGTE